jgi:hypothetical protein
MMVTLKLSITVIGKSGCTPAALDTLRVIFQKTNRWNFTVGITHAHLGFVIEALRRP